MHLTMNCHNDPAYEILFDDLIQEVFGFCPDWLGIVPEWQAADPGERTALLHKGGLAAAGVFPVSCLI